MRKKFKEIAIILLLTMVGFTIAGCIEEPTVEPIKRPFSEIRLVNLSNNVDGMRILIDDQQIATLAITGSTGYFDVKSGVRVFKIYNSSNDLIFEKELTIISYDRATLVFSGFYSSDPLLNTFSNFEIVEGEVYVPSNPNAGRANIYVVNSASEVDTTESKEFYIRGTVTPVGGTPVETVFNNGADSTVVFGETFSIGNVLPGEFAFRFISDGVTVNAPAYTISAGMRYYLFIYGHPNNVQFFINEVVPQPQRNK